MSKKKILITVIVIVAIGVAAIILASYKSPVSPGVSEETGGGEPTAGTETPEGAPVTGTGTPEGTSVSGTEVSGGTPVAEERPSGETEKPKTQEFQGMNYEIVGVGSSADEDEVNRSVYDIVTGELTEEQAKTLAAKIIGDITAKDPKLEEITLLFYSDKSSAAAGEYDIAYVIWVPEGTSVRMIE